MALNSIKFRIEGDGSAAIRALNDVKRGAMGLKDTLVKELGTKITKVFSVYAVADMVRRTGEWADELQRAATKLQVTTSELQGFRLAGAKMGIDKGEVEGYFSTMQDAAEQALMGNAEYMRSLDMIGVKLEDLAKNPAETFSKMLQKIGEGSESALMGASKLFGRTGTIDLQMMAKEMGGLSGAAYAEQSEFGVSDDEIAKITVAWRQLVEQTKGFTAQIAPLVSFILGALTEAMRFLKGVVGLVRDRIKDIFTLFGQLASGDFKGAMKTMGKMTVGRGLELVSGLTRGVTLGFLNKPIEESTDYWRYLLKEKAGVELSAAEREHAQAVGSGAGGLLLGYGAGKALPHVVRGIGRSPEWGADMIIMGRRNLYARMKGYSKGSFEGAYDAADAMRSIYDLRMKHRRSLTGPGGVRVPSHKAMRRLDWLEDLSGPIGQAARKYWEYSGAPLPFEKLAAWVSRGAGQAGIFGSLGSIGNARLMEQMKGIKAPQWQGYHPFLGANASAFGIGGGGGDGGGNHLKIGGVFGMDVSSKIIQLNTDMLFTMQRMLAIMESNQSGMGYVHAVNLY